MIEEKIEYVYHLADLHIRNLQRHKEYRSVFKKFIKQVKQDNIKNSVIYIAGDIAHAKTEMSPELVQEISWLFNECANLRDTFVITGNHDCNLNNDHRLDVLTPIVDNLNHPKLHYLRDTGVTKFKNLTFVVYSILDHRKNWPGGYTIEGENKICLFHGPVNKAATDIGYTVSSNSFMVDMFDGFDMVMLGDIHKRQILQNFSESKMKIGKDEWEEYEKQKWVILQENADTYEIYKKTPIVAYAGSMVQQNHGEMLDNHGYILWNVKEKTFQDFHIHNDFGYMTIDVVKGEIPQWVYDEIDTILPKFPRLRLRFTDTDAASMKLCIAELKKMFKTPEVTVTRTDTMGKMKTGAKLNKNIVGEVNEINFQNNLIRDYLERQYLLEDKALDKIDLINSEMNDKIDKENLAENILWLPKTFEFSNMFSYGEGNKVAFDKANGIIGIFAPNASGKSSLFDALSFCIYDKASRAYMAKNIMNNRKDMFYCKFNFEVDGVDYFIERTAKWTRKRSNVKVDVNFWKDDGGIIESLNGEQRRDTNLNIEKFLGKFEDFILTTLSLQGNNALFIDKSQSERKEILSQFIGVDIFDKLYQIASDENRDNSILIRKFNRDDFTSRLANITKEHNELKISFIDKQTNLNDTNLSVDGLNEKLVLLNSKLVKLNSDLVGIDELQKRLSILQEKLDTNTDQRKTNEKRIDKLEDLQIKLEEILDTFDEEELTDAMERLQRSRKRQDELHNEIDKVNILLSSLTDRLEHLNTHKYDENCEICMINADSIIKAKKDVETNIGTEREKLLQFGSEETSIQQLIIALLKSEISYTNMMDAKSKEATVDRELTSLINKMNLLESEETNLKIQITTQKSLIQEYYSYKEQIEKNRSTRKEIEKVQGELKILKDQSKTLSDEVMRIHGKISALENEKESIDKRINEVKELESQSKLFDYYLNAIGKNGVSYELIEKALPMIEGEVNNILGQIVEFGMQLEIDGKNINAYLVYGDQRWSLEMCSGMERFISGLAIRVALINICNLPRPNFLVIDEGFGTLDSDNMLSLYQLFSYLKTQFDFVMVISHIDSMRDVVDNLIEIKKIDGFSKIKF